MQIKLQWAKDGELNADTLKRFAASITWGLQECDSAGMTHEDRGEMLSDIAHECSKLHTMAEAMSDAHLIRSEEEGE